MDAVAVSGLSKLYRLGVGAFARRTLYETISEGLRPIARSKSRSRRDEFWALRDISFDVPAGQVVGVIGRNGAGKTTLLKVLSRITAPSAGRAVLRGRVASLLEVGTGFHPELTGRENVFLNGSILGLSKQEIRARFDQIVDFAGTHEFLDTPVKRYSTGMQVRLAFAVAAHLAPDILVIDEVLAVGDAEFRARCLERLGESARGGRTVLVVSHDLAAIEGLTKRCLLLEAGRLAADGPTKEVVSRYLQSVEGDGACLIEGAERHGSGKVRVVSLRVRDKAGLERGIVRSGEPISFEIGFEASQDVGGARVAVGIYDHLGRDVALLDSEVSGARPFEVEKGTWIAVVRLEDLPLNAGLYWLNVALLRGAELLEGVVRARAFTVEAGDYFGSGRLPDRGVLLLRSRWSSGETPKP
jgi:lipopolysaccharide transport system ATP-binding protein